jgi:glycosyltransferase, WecB/TagA/CpsF family
VLHGILNSASLVVPDGAGILWAAERMGERVPERVTGVDVTKELFKVAADTQIPVYCLGAAPGVAEQAVSNLQAMFGPINIAGIHDGFFDEAEEHRIIKNIEDTGAKLVFVALGVPKQEQWISEKLSSLQGVVAIGIGGSFDVLAGNIPRAPQWMQKNRLEWLYRLYLEPKRIGRMLAIPKFMWTVIKNK